MLKRDYPPKLVSEPSTLEILRSRRVFLTMELVGLLEQDLFCAQGVMPFLPVICFLKTYESILLCSNWSLARELKD